MLDDTERAKPANEAPPPPEPPVEPPEEPSGEPAPSVESLQRELSRAQRYADLYRQQRNNATMLANDLQADLAACQADLAEANQQLAALTEA